MKAKKGEILIRTIKEVNPVSQYKGRRFILGIVTTTGRTYYIQGSDQDNVQGYASVFNLPLLPMTNWWNSWINGINEVIGKSDPAPANSSNSPPPRELGSNAPPPRQQSYEVIVRISFIILNVSNLQHNSGM